MGHDSHRVASSSSSASGPSPRCDRGSDYRRISPARSPEARRSPESYCPCRAAGHSTAAARGGLRTAQSSRDPCRTRAPPPEQGCRPWYIPSQDRHGRSRYRSGRTREESRSESPRTWGHTPQRCNHGGDTHRNNAHLPYRPCAPARTPKPRNSHTARHGRALRSAACRARIHAGR